MNCMIKNKMNFLRKCGNILSITAVVALHIFAASTSKSVGFKTITTPNENGASGTSLYELLGVPKGAAKDEIKKAYRKEALKCHPDKNQGDDEETERFKKINHANTVLTDDTKRRIYDSYGSLGLYVAEQFGEENVSTYFLVTSGWCKGLFIFCGTITLCYCCCCFCCCCNFCCGRCKPKHEEHFDDFEDLQREAEDDAADVNDSRSASPITTQPTSKNEPIVLGPSPGDSNGVETEKTPIYSPEEKPQMYDGYRY